MADQPTPIRRLRPLKRAHGLDFKPAEPMSSERQRRLQARLKEIDDCAARGRWNARFYFVR